MHRTIKTTALCAALTLSVAHHIQAQGLLITEMNSNASLGDFWELTNFGPSTVNLFNGVVPWSWDDDSDTPDSVVLPLGISIASGESVVFIASGINGAGVATFRSGWNIAASVQVIGITGSPGLGQNDRVTLYDDLDLAAATFNYAAAGFTRTGELPSLGGHAGISAGGTLDVQSAIWDPTFGNTPATARYTFANGTNFGSYDAPGSTGFGSPGIIPEPTSLALIGAGLALAGLRRARRA